MRNPQPPLTRADLHSLLWWTVDDAARALGTTAADVESRIAAGTLPAREDGRGRARVHRDDVRRAGQREGRAA
jgi:hypothetical protein